MILKKCCILFKIEQFEGVQLYLFSLGYKWINGLNFKLFSNDTVFMHTKKYEHDASYKYIMIDENNGMFSNTNTMRYKYKYIKYVNLLRKDKFKKLL